MPELPTGVFTFLFTDIEGSTKLWERHPQSMQAALNQHDTILKSTIEDHRGHIFKTVGDGFYAAFHDSQDAVAAALAIQRSLHSKAWPDTGPIRVRMALHTGAAEERNQDYFGPTLNRVARLLSAGHGGQILLSSATVDALNNCLPGTTSLRDFGERRLKDLVRPEHIFQLIAEDLPADFPALKTLDTFPDRPISDLLEIITLGGISIRSNGKLVSGFASRKAEALLVYLAYTQRQYAREVLADLLWDDRSSEQGLSNLRTILTSLRKHLAPYLEATRQTVGLAPGYQLDVLELEAGLKAAANDWKAGNTLSQAAASKLEQALALYRGNFLEGFSIYDSRGFEDWLLVERERLQQQVIEGLHHLIESYLAYGTYHQAISQITRLLQLDSLREEAYGQLLIALASTGQRSAALEQYELCRQLLDQELGISPSHALTELYQQIQSGRFVPSRTPTGSIMVEALPSYSLPQQATPFVGRTTELQRLTQRFADPACRLLTLVGPGGIGKTRLALQFASEQIAHFPQGVYFVSLAPLTTPASIVVAIAEAIHFAFYPQGDPKQQLVDYLCTKRLLLILDNIEHLLPGTSLISDILRTSPSIRLLVTSRERLKLDGEYVFRVESLECGDWKTPEDALGSSVVQLFLQSARRVKADFALTQNNLKEIAQICRLVEGMPLGILLAAAWVEVLSLSEIIKEIKSNLGFLEVDHQDVPKRQRSMRSAFEYSWMLLADTERDIFKKLSVFRGGFTRHAAEQVADAPLKALMTLVNKSLLRCDVTNERYDVHELLRQFAHEHLTASPDDYQAVLDAHCVYYAEFMNRQWARLKTSQQPSVLEDIECEFDNVRVAWQHMVQQRKLPELRKTMLSLWHFFSLRSQYPEAIDLFSAAVDSLSTAHSDEDRDVVLAHLLCVLGKFYLAAGLSEKGKLAIEQGMALLPRMAQPEDTILPLEGLLQSALQSGQYVKTQQIIQEGLQIARQIGDQWPEAWFLYWSGVVMLAQEAFDEALVVAHESLKLATLCGDIWLRACLCSFVLGKAANALKDYTEAKNQFRQGLAFFEAIGQPWGISASYWNLGNAAYLAGNYDEAEYHYRQSLKIFNATGQPHHSLGVLYDLATLFAARGEKVRAAHLLKMVQEEDTASKDIREKAFQFLRELSPELSAEDAQLLSVQNREAILNELLDLN